MVATPAHPPARFGIEEEAFLVDGASLDLARQVPPEWVQACRRALGNCFAEEMFQCQAELVSPVFRQLGEAAAFLARGRAQLAELAQAHGLRSLVVGAHPFSRLADAAPSEPAHYRALFEDYVQPARNSLLCGLHVHVEVPPGLDRVALMNRVLPWAPLLLALSCSSPFWQGRHTGLASYRRALSGQWPRMDIPPWFDDEPAYQAYLKLLHTRGLMREPGHAWWFVRPSARYPTLELRISDACPRLADALCIAGLFRALLTQAMADADAEEPHRLRALLAENYWQAQRHGCRARFLLADGDCVDLARWLALAWGQCGTAARAGNEWAYAHACRLIREGGSAVRQVRSFRRHLARGGDVDEALREVVVELLEENSQAPVGLA
ncbi:MULTISPECIES: carboxylate-amine ligase [unclassified Pseudomonas]|uniref:carboxylate-amine ligase n=1 Tax=unclassified Pseudomonas TaxID=196821 RepID=UPI0002A22308|nr:MULTISPECIES: carboxylate-amine ligase [unclassified Pseudomonas]MBB1605071.1 carboxylate-amine ligase [Pseudomonas sp. UMC76]MBB1639960.1 carboxylate-amine ligase [Pseudomonas sp. UME83]NTX92514.1 carboxylate-amine ligase [Pseudomonas sp. UMA643]NTY21795.1 carboxylate-amine ligase [Pseudomonas sp. UMC3103]NTY27966.1 carboxylate-amine ligase [Pseudomonas sp. UMA603]